ncbi:MAG: hypothetical protein U9R72_13975 [Chloroflexota bacterium]|nr:hypothetical protein [Chloroflexota bacterium]
MSKWTKVIGSIMAVALLATAFASVAMAQEPVDEDGVGTGARNRFGFVNQDGVNQRNREDCDGVPAYDGEGNGHRFGSEANEDCDGEALRARDGSGAGYGFGFVDEDSDGVNDRCDGDCDGIPDGDGQGAGQRFGLENQDGNAMRRGRGGR